MVHFVEMMVPIAFFATAFGIIYIIIQARNKERMAMIEQGNDPRMFAENETSKGKLVKVAMFIIGAGIGLVIGSFADMIGLLPEGLAQISMLLVFAGGGLLWSHFIVKKLEDKGGL